MKININEFVTVSFNGNKQPTQINYEGDPYSVSVVKEELSRVTGMEGHFIDTDFEFPLDFCYALNKKYNVGIDLSNFKRVNIPSGDFIVS